MRAYLAARREILRSEGIDPERLERRVENSPQGPELLRRFAQLAVTASAVLITVRLTAPKSLVRDRLRYPREGASEANMSIYETMSTNPEPFHDPCIHVDTRYDVAPSVALVRALVEEVA